MPAQDDQLGWLLKTWRARLAPSDAGLPAGGARRAVGLRREELAALAGLSVDYVVRLEQGRARHPSDQVATALARALQLDDAERDHLFRSAGLLPPTSAVVSRHIPPGVQRLVGRLRETPVAVFSASWDLLTYSPLWGALLGDPEGWPAGERNIVVRAFRDARRASGPDGEPPTPEPAGGADTAVRTRHLDGASGARFRAALVADLRRALVDHPADPHLRGLVDGLLASEPAFAELWAQGAVGVHESARKVMDHPLVGPLELDCDVFTVPGSELAIVAYTAAEGSPAAAALDFLRVGAVGAAGAFGDAGGSPDAAAASSPLSEL
ncbi:helix-turn-helix transcriptional regulator [Frigoribacterium sp. PvP032]|uniref:helix-turn-helix transcriptional regulator n=1 Tax=Frigoribacterium sp. PvP032 TaxID=2806589 RepID=UPI001AE8DE64|nr:helix-turn-helix transcriptional regulator [Frigoribacterium sp. PvP032]MBP1189324.1 transcriptional regulator with XRE-family HTH domain [Frigoribacterium sp. PvP032]